VSEISSERVREFVGSSDCVPEPLNSAESVGIGLGVTVVTDMEAWRELVRLSEGFRDRLTECVHDAVPLTV
jgi:hypothetical protein